MRTENVLCLMNIHFLPAICFVGSLNSKHQFNLQAAKDFLLRLHFALLCKCKLLRENTKHHLITGARDRSFCYIFSSEVELKNKRQLGLL